MAAPAWKGIKTEVPGPKSEELLKLRERYVPAGGFPDSPKALLIAGRDAGGCRW